MKKIICIILFTLAIFSCTKETATEHNNDEFYTIKLHATSADISIIETPLKSSNSNQLYFINIRQQNLNSGYYEDYAYGAFESLSNAEVKLKKGYKYHIYAMMYVDYFSALDAFTVEGGTEGAKKSTTITNAFVYDDSHDITEARSGSFWVPGASYKSYDHPELDAFGTQIEGYEPTSNGLIELNLKRVSFGLTVKVNGLLDGKIRCYFNATSYHGSHVDPTFFLTPDSPDHSGIYCPYRLWEGSETNTVWAYYVDANEKETELLCEQIEFKANVRTTVNINVTYNNTPEGNYGVKANINQTDFSDESTSFNAII